MLANTKKSLESGTVTIISGKESIVSLARYVYLIIAIGYVGYGFVGTIQKMLEDRIVVSITENELAKFTFPSITFCYPYIHKDNKNNIGKEIGKTVWTFQHEPGTGYSR